MQEKQTLKGVYGIREEQLRRYYQEAHHATTETGPSLVALLERRLDNAVFRAGFAPTRPMARQLVSHRLLEVNGRPVTIPSLRLSVGDTVTVKESKRGKAVFANLPKSLQNVAPPAWLALIPDTYGFKVIAEPDADEASLGVDIRAIVEYFAR